MLLQHFHVRDSTVPLLPFACAITSWYEGAAPAPVAVLLPSMWFDYFFVQPLHSFGVSKSELPYFIIFASFAGLVSWFSTIRRRVEIDLRQTRDKLRIEVEERSSLLNSTHDSTFVRGMDSILPFGIKVRRNPSNTCTIGEASWDERAKIAQSSCLI